MSHERLYCGSGVLRRWVCLGLGLLLSLALCRPVTATNTVVYLDNTQFNDLRQTYIDVLNAFNANGSVVSAVYTNVQTQVSYLQALIASQNSFNTAQASTLTSINTAVQQIGTAFTNISALSGFNGLGTGINNLGQEIAYMRAVNVTNVIPAMRDLISTLTNMPPEIGVAMTNLISAVFVANSNLVNSTNLAALAGLVSLTNLASVSALTNITTELQLVNSNLLTLTNFGLSTEGLLDMAEAIGGAVSNAQTVSGIMLSNAIVANGDMQRTFDASPTNWPYRIFTNGFEALVALGIITNQNDHIYGALTGNGASLLGISNGIANLEGQGIIAATKRDEIRDGIRELVGIQRTNTPSLGVTVTNSNGQGEAVAGIGLGAGADMEGVRSGILAGTIGSGASVASPTAGIAFSGPTIDNIPGGLDTDPFVLRFTLQGVERTIDANPMRSAFAPMIAWVRSALVWVFTLGFMYACGKLASEFLLHFNSTNQLGYPNFSLAGFNVGAVAAPVFIAVYVGIAVVFSTAVAAVFDGGTVATLAANPFAGVSWGPSATGALWLANQVLPLQLVVAQAIWLLTSRYTLLGAAWVAGFAVKVMMK